MAEGARRRRRMEARSVARASALFLVCALLAPGTGAPAQERVPSAADLASIEAIPLDCADGAVEKVLPWNISGYSKGCYRRGVAHGPIIFWEQGYLNLSGSFSDGRKDGAWTVFHRDGARYVTIHFKGGVKTGKTIHSSPGGGAAVAE